MRLESRQLFVILAAVVLSACKSTWTADELSSWYERYAEGSPHYSKLWYYGSDSDYHSFRCRAIDSWIHPRVPRDEIALQDVRPVDDSSSGPFPGYYAVDPSNGFKPIPESDNRPLQHEQGQRPNAGTGVH